MQRLRDPDENNWQHNIIPLTEVASLQPTSRNKLRAHLKNVRTGVETEVDFDVVIVATGYNRSIPQSLLQNTKDLLVKDSTGSECWNIGRDYKLQYGEGKVASNAGIWLQGCCESTHGVSNYPEFKSCPAYWLTSIQPAERYFTFHLSHKGWRDCRFDLWEAGECISNGNREFSTLDESCQRLQQRSDQKHQQLSF